MKVRMVEGETNAGWMCFDIYEVGGERRRVGMLVQHGSRTWTHYIALEFVGQTEEPRAFEHFYGDKLSKMKKAVREFYGN